MAGEEEEYMNVMSGGGGGRPGHLDILSGVTVDDTYFHTLVQGQGPSPPPPRPHLIRSPSRGADKPLSPRVATLKRGSYHQGEPPASFPWPPTAPGSPSQPGLDEGVYSTHIAPYTDPAQGPAAGETGNVYQHSFSVPLPGQTPPLRITPEYHEWIRISQHLRQLEALEAAGVLGQKGAPPGPRYPLGMDNPLAPHTPGALTRHLSEPAPGNPDDVGYEEVGVRLSDRDQLGFSSTDDAPPQPPQPSPPPPPLPSTPRKGSIPCVVTTSPSNVTAAALSNQRNWMNASMSSPQPYTVSSIPALPRYPPVTPTTTVTMATETAATTSLTAAENPVITESDITDLLQTTDGTQILQMLRVLAEEERTKSRRPSSVTLPRSSVIVKSRHTKCACCTRRVVVIVMLVAMVMGMIGAFVGGWFLGKQEDGNAPGVTVTAMVDNTSGFTVTSAEYITGATSNITFNPT